ncbi:MAG: FHA domain-containing protein [Methylocystis sp.]
MLYLHILESSFDIRGETTKVVDKPIYRIGRAPDNDWILDCPKKLISRHHCIIECIGNAYTINDLSKNGVIINNSPAPIGLGNIGALNDGDLINLPGVKISVSFSKNPRPVGNDPFLKLLPKRDKPIATPSRASDPLLTQFSGGPEKKYDAVSDLDDLALPTRQPKPYLDQRYSAPFQPRTPNQGIGFDRRPAEFNSFQSALPQIMTIPEDWNNDDEGIRLETLVIPSQPMPEKGMSPQIELLLRIISQLCEIDQTLSQTKTSNLMFLSDAEKLKNLAPLDLERAFSIIDNIIDKLSAHITTRTKLSDDSHQPLELIARNDEEHDTISEIIPKPR